MSSDDLQQDIAKQQNAVDAINAQIQQAQDRNQEDMIPGLQAQAKEHSDQIQQLNAKLSDALKQEKKEAEEKAREEQKKKDEEQNDNSFGLF